LYAKEERLKTTNIMKAQFAPAGFKFLLIFLCFFFWVQLCTVKGSFQQLPLQHLLPESKTERNALLR
jgi:hypothetical protein